MVAIVDAISFVHSYPTRATWHPRQPVGGKPSSTTWATEEELFRYDLITPYGVGANQAANQDQEIHVMVAFDLMLKLLVRTDQDVNFLLYADAFDGTYEIFDSLLIAGMADWQIFEYPPIPCFFLSGTFERDTVNATELFVHSSMVPY